MNAINNLKDVQGGILPFASWLHTAIDVYEYMFDADHGFDGLG